MIIFTHFIQKSVLISEKIIGVHPIWMGLLTNLDVVNHWISLLHFLGMILKIFFTVFDIKFLSRQIMVALEHPNFGDARAIDLWRRYRANTIMKSKKVQ